MLRVSGRVGNALSVEAGLGRLRPNVPPSTNPALAMAWRVSLLPFEMLSNHEIRHLHFSLPLANRLFLQSELDAAE